MSLSSKIRGCMKYLGNDKCIWVKEKMSVCRKECTGSVHICEECTNMQDLCAHPDLNAQVLCRPDLVCTMNRSNCADH